MHKLKPFKVVFYDFDKERTDPNEVQFNSLEEMQNHQVLVEAKNSTYKGCRFAYFYFRYLNTRLNLVAKYGKTTSGHGRLLGYVADDTDKETIDVLLSIASAPDKESDEANEQRLSDSAEQFRKIGDPPKYADGVSGKTQNEVNR